MWKNKNQDFIFEKHLKSSLSCLFIYFLIISLKLKLCILDHSILKFVLLFICHTDIKLEVIWSWISSECLHEKNCVGSLIWCFNELWKQFYADHFFRAFLFSAFMLNCYSWKNLFRIKTRFYHYHPEHLSIIIKTFLDFQKEGSTVRIQPFCHNCNCCLLIF